MIRRLVLALTALFLLSACIGVTMDDKDPHDSKAGPTARSTSDGVEVWDLTGRPSAKAFGISDETNDGTYETKAARAVRFKLPGGRTIETQATLVSFYRAGSGSDARFTVGIRTAQLEPGALVTTFRDALTQLDVPTEPADTLAAEIEAAPDDQTERISVGSETVTLGDLKVSAQAGLAPVAGSGRVIVGGSWSDD